MTLRAAQSYCLAGCRLESPVLADDCLKYKLCLELYVDLQFITLWCMIIFFDVNVNRIHLFL